MVSPSWFCGVGERDRFRRMGEQAGVLRLELLAVLQGQMERGNEVEREEEGRKAVSDSRSETHAKEPAREPRQQAE